MWPRRAAPAPPRQHRRRRGRRRGSGAVRASLCALLLSAAAPAAAAGGKSIFKIGSEVDHAPFEVMLMYWTCFLITVIYESLIEYVNKTVTTHSGSQIVHHVYAEIMILGSISAVLTVFENLGGTALFEAGLFHFVHFVVFVMALCFIVLITTLFTIIDKSWKKWSNFEVNITELETDPSLRSSERSAFLRQYVRRTKNGRRMIACILFFRKGLGPHAPPTAFVRYMKKQQRDILLDFITFHPRTWAALSVLCATAAVVTWVILNVIGTKNALATMALWAVLVGFGPLIVLTILIFKIRKEFRKFTLDLQYAKENNATLTRDQKKYFFFGKPHVMKFMMQTMLIFQVFYIANAICNFSWRLYDQGGLAPYFIPAMFVPTMIVFLFVIPRILPPYSIISSLGQFQDHHTLERMWHADAMGGKRRRQDLRDRTISRTALFINEDAKHLRKDCGDACHAGHEQHAEDHYEAADLLAGGCELEDIFGVHDKAHAEHADEHGHLLDDGHGDGGHGGHGDGGHGGHGGHGHGGHGDSHPIMSQHEGELPSPPGKHGHGGHGGGHGGHGHAAIPDFICEECHKAPAREACSICGLLCHNCTEDYHSLMLFRDHNPIKITRKGLFAPEKPITTDNPIINDTRTANHFFLKSGDASDSKYNAKSHGHGGHGHGGGH